MNQCRFCIRIVQQPESAALYFEAEDSTEATGLIGHNFRSESNEPPFLFSCFRDRSSCPSDHRLYSQEPNRPRPTGSKAVASVIKELVKNKYTRLDLSGASARV